MLFVWDEEVYVLFVREIGFICYSYGMSRFMCYSYERWGVYAIRTGDGICMLFVREMGFVCYSYGRWDLYAIRKGDGIRTG